MRWILWILSCGLLSAKTIWFIRHCDKPVYTEKNAGHEMEGVRGFAALQKSRKSNEKYCCSDLGYERADHWATYFRKRIPNHFEMYASNYFNHSHPGTKKCPKSQRMYLTALAIQPDTTRINTKYCTGEWRPLIREALSSTTQHIIIVWEHKEIVQMLRYLGVDMPRWPNRFRDLYHIVFRVSDEEFGFECFDFRMNTTRCREDVRDWLKDATQSARNKKKDDLMPNLRISSAIDTAGYFTGTMIFLLFSGLCCSAFCHILFCCIRLRRRQGYTAINV